MSGGAGTVISLADFLHSAKKKKLDIAPRLNAKTGRGMRGMKRKSRRRTRGPRLPRRTEIKNAFAAPEGSRKLRYEQADIAGTLADYFGFVITEVNNA